MRISTFLEKAGYSRESIQQIYHGKDNWCRCGCGGKYFEPGERGFTRAFNAMNKEDFLNEEHLPEIKRFGGECWVNITLPEWENKAYTIYFKKGNNQ